jgi:signal transduction histidine kinase
MTLRERMLRLAKASRLPRRTVRLRLTLLYGLVFLMSGAALLTTTYLLVDAATGNAFIEHTKNGVTIAGYQIGSPPRVGASSREKVGRDAGVSASGSLQTNSNHASKSGAAGGALTRSAGPVLANGTLSKKQIAQAQKGVAQQQAEFETFAHAYQSSELHQLLIESGLGLAIMAVLSVALGWLMAGRILRPLRTITTTTRNISASNLHERLDLDGPDDELKELGQTIDGLLGRLHASFQSQRQFVANASHELRTPLARQRTLAQVALSDPDSTADSLRLAHERILASGEQQEQLIDSLLTLSRAQSTAVSLRPVDLAAIVHEVVAAREADAGVHGLHLRTSLRSAALECDPRLVERLVVNLVDNALRHNEAGGGVNVETGYRGGAASLVVSNDGPVIRPDEVDRLYEPFERVGAERTAAGEGFGLGLCIVQAVAAAHGGTLRTAARPGGGLRIEVLFPAAARTEEGPLAPQERSSVGRTIQPELVHASASDH